MGEMNCQFCNETINSTLIDGIVFEHKCPVCGEYYTYYNEFETEITFNRNATASYLFYKKELKNRFLGTKEQFDKLNEKYPNKHFSLITSEEIEAFWPQNFSDKVANILIWLDSHTNYPSQTIRINRRNLYSLFFLDQTTDFHEIQRQYSFYTHYFNQQSKYVHVAIYDNYFDLWLNPEGYKKLEELHLSNKNNKKVFIAMAFNDNTLKTREAIRAGIIKAKYDATLIDEIIHNKQIVPEMFRLIRESRLLVMDITEPNYGAYYEAGYAQGLGKEVIITCSQERFNKKYQTKKEKEYERFLKPHFDIQQKQILVWKDEEELTKKLSEWIKAIE